MAGKNGSAKIITVFNQKGGCGKTTTSVQLGGGLGERGLKVYIVDMDLQNTAALWHLSAKPDHPFPADAMSYAPLKGAFIEKLGPLTEKYDVIIVDCPPALESLVPWASLLVSDLAIIPVVPVMDNIWASKQAEQLVEEAKKQNPSLKAAYLLNMLRRGNVFDSCLAQLRAKAQLPILKTEVAMRNVYPESQLFGCTVSAFGKSKASKEVDSYVKEIAHMLGLKLKGVK